MVPFQPGFETYMGTRRGEVPPAREVPEPFLEPELPHRRHVLEPSPETRHQRPALPGAVSGPEIQREPGIRGTRSRDSSTRHPSARHRHDQERANSTVKISRRAALIVKGLSYVSPDSKTPERVSPVLDSVAALIDAMLREDLDAPRKQRHTSRRIWQRLADEHGMPVSYSYVCQYAGPRRADIEAEHRAGSGSVAGYVPQAKEPGAEAEVDFGPVSIVLAGEVAACHLFAYRLSYSGKGIHRVYACCAQEAFFEGHVTAFEVAGGVPWRHIRYDNLSAAVSKVMCGRNRTETARWASFRSWYGFEAFYCGPGLDGAHEKGGVEGEIGRYRRRWMVPVPRVASLAELNARLAEADVIDDRRHIEYRAAAVAADFAAEQRFLGPLPGDGFDTGTVLWPRADKFARISVGKCRYSVPARLIGARVRIRLTANELEVFD